MKKNTLSTMGVFLGILFLSTGLSPQQDPLTILGNLRIVKLDGSPYQRGFQHGKALKGDIHALIKLWKADIQRKYKTEADVFIKKFLENTDYPAAVKKWTPELLEEVRGIADGSDVDYDIMFAFQLVDEMWVLGGEIIGGDHCTTIGANRTKSAPAMVSQTLDIPAFYHGFQTLLHIKDPHRDLVTLLFTFPGFIAANGLNNRSVAVVVNAVQQLEHSREGLPVAFVIRGILQRKTFKEAVSFLHSIRFGAPQNFMIGGPERAGSYECSSSQVEEFIPFRGADFTYHTNHPLKNKHFTPGVLDAFRSRNIRPEDYVFKCRRFEFLQKVLDDNSAEFGIERLKSIYRDRESGINNRSTFGVTIIVLGENPVLHISPGRPDETPYQIFTFDGRIP